MDADGARSLGICAAAARPEMDADRGRRETFVDGRLFEYLDGPALALRLESANKADRCLSKVRSQDSAGNESPSGADAEFGGVLFE